jgi:hypothetical protein
MKLPRFHGPTTAPVSNLHQALIRNADGPDVRFCDTPDPSLSSNETNFYFRDLQRHLLEEIRKADFVLGAVAWLTDPALIEALSQTKHGAAMLVQKEDFLRSDCEDDNRSAWAQRLRAGYEKLDKGTVGRVDLPMGAHLSYMYDSGKGMGVRCVGNYNRTKNPATPRMHNKFAIFCRVVKNTDEYSYPSYFLQPYAYWTGSFNWSLNAGRSFENAVLTYDTKVAEAAASEWGNIYALSEPLDWETDWCEPEFRIGS